MNSFPPSLESSLDDKHNGPGPNSLLFKNANKSSTCKKHLNSQKRSTVSSSISNSVGNLQKVLRQYSVNRSGSLKLENLSNQNEAEMEDEVFRAFEKEFQEISDPVCLMSLEPLIDESLPEALATSIKVMLYSKLDELNALNSSEDNKEQKPSFCLTIEEEQDEDSQFPMYDSLAKDFKESESTISENLASKILQTEMSQIKDLAEKSSELKTHNHEESEGDGPLDDIILKSFYQSYCSLLGHLTYSKNKSFKINVAQEIFGDFSCFMDFIELQWSPEDSAVLKKDHLIAFETSLTKTKDAILKYFCALQQEFSTALEGWNLQTVNHLLIYSQDLKSFVTILQEHASSDNDKITGFSIIVAQIWTYDLMFTKFLGKILEITNEILAADFLNSKVNSQGEEVFCAFYKDLGVKLFKFFEVNDYKELEIGTKPIYEDLIDKLLGIKKDIYNQAKNSLEELFTSLKTNFVPLGWRKFSDGYQRLRSFEKFLASPQVNSSPFTLKKLEDEFTGNLDECVKSFIEIGNLEVMMQAQNVLDVLATNFIEIESLQNSIKESIRKILSQAESL